MTRAGLADAFVLVAGGMAMLVVVAGLLPPMPIPADPAGLPIHAAFGLFVVAAVAMLNKRPRVSVALQLVAWFAVYRGWTAPLDSDGADGRLKVLYANVKTSNTDHGAILSLVAREDPDVVALVETDKHWIAGLASLQTTHPHTALRPRRDNFGVAIYSRFPLEKAAWVSMTELGLPTGAVRIAGLDLIVTHAPPPLTVDITRHRDAHLAALAEQTAPRQVILGDLNATPQSPAFRRLLHNGQLRSACAGPSWPAPWPAVLRIAIDHVVVRDAQVSRCRVGPDIGSDHRPLLFEVR